MRLRWVDDLLWRDLYRVSNVVCSGKNSSSQLQKCVSEAYSHQMQLWAIYFGVISTVDYAASKYKGLLGTLS